MSIAVKKDNIHKIVDELPDNATLEDLMHKIYVIECIEQGLEAAENGETTEVSELRKKYGLTA
ncbi:MAG: hypothetical protein ACYTGH_06785 [Planctomycetota bacterium]|jgi:hypothetical protein